MVTFGMRRNTAGKWIKNLSDVNLIELTDDRKINFK